MGGTLVSPPAIITVMLAAPIWLLLLILRRISLPREALPWLAFCGAVVFSCSLLHEATAVTKGTRYATLPFLYDDASAAVRVQNLHLLQPEPAAAE